MIKSEINLLPKQTDAWNAFEDPFITEIGYGGAAGGGKTRLGWYLVVTTCGETPGIRWAVGRKELKTLKTTTLTELWSILLELGYGMGTHYKYDGSLNILRFNNGSEVLMLDTAFSPQDPEYTRFGSLPLTHAWLDESNETPDKAKAILKTRVNRNNKFGDKVIKGIWLETFNPNKGHVYRDYYKLWKENKLPTYRVFIRALPGDNPYLPKAYIEGLERADKTTKERLLRGNFEYDDNPQKLMAYDCITDLPFNALLPTPTDKIKTLICDVARFGGDKIVLGTFKGLELYSLGVYTYQGTDETVRLMRLEAQEEGIPFSNVLADEDGIGGGVVDNMKGIKGFHGGATPTLIWDYIRGKLSPANFQNFRSQAYFKLSDIVNDHLMSTKITKFKTNIEGYTVESALSDLFEELDAIKKTDNSEDGKQAVVPKSEIKEQLGRSPDFADILMMRMFYELKDEVDIGQPTYYNNNAPKVNKAR